MGDRLLICDLDKKTRIVRDDNSFILQIRESNKVWTDLYYWFSISDMVRGYVNYVSKYKLKPTNNSGINALISILDEIEKEVDDTCEKLTKVFDSDLLEIELKRKDDDEEAKGTESQ